MADNGPYVNPRNAAALRLLTSRQSSSTGVYDHSALRPDDEAAAYGRYAGVLSHAS
jgi:hypothetical protein